MNTRLLRRGALGVAGLGVGALIWALVVGTASANHPGAQLNADVAPQFEGDNPTCSTLLDAGDFLFEFKMQPVQDETIPLSFGAQNFTLTVDVRDTADGPVFDFSFSNGFGVAGVFVKGGPNGNLYDYRPLEGVTSDEDLHAPVNHSNNRFFGLSHVSFCIIQVETELEIVKTAVDDLITVGESPKFDITVTNIGTVTAENVVIDDTLPAAGSPWTDNKAECDITGGDVLHCDVGDLEPSASFTVRVTGSAMTADDCGEVLNNTAFADADNADQVSDDASITVECGGVKVVKTAKHADTSGATSPNLAATFQITDKNGDTHEVTTDATTGVACVDDLPLGAASVVELSGPGGYAEDTDTENVTVTDADCPNPGAGATASFENVPLTDITWSVDSQHDGATSTTVDCKDSEGNSLPGYPMTVSDGTDTLPDLLPTDPSVTVTCDFTVDP